MFFSPELLSRRDSGFGLLWLAATLGSKSAFKKLPKRSILTADISGLCDLISEPTEPLALRLSSNLLVGVARVYKVKQEIFLTDVTTCFTSLKKVVHDMKSSLSGDSQLQMTQPCVRSSAVTLSADTGSFMMEFDALLVGWDAYLNIETQDTDDQDFTPKSNSRKKQGHSKLGAPEIPRAERCTLNESHDHLLSASFDLSFQGNDRGAGLSSSQDGVNFGFNDNDDLFAMPPDGMDIDGLGDELAKELGWVENIFLSPPPEPAVDDMDFNFADAEIPLTNDENFEDKNNESPIHVDHSQIINEDIHNLLPEIPGPQEPSPTKSFSQMLLSQDDIQPASPSLDEVAHAVERDPAEKKTKRTRPLIDGRTELTDDELKIARSEYLQMQLSLRRGLDYKTLQNSRGRMLGELIWSVPKCINAPTLIHFWKENFRTQAEGRIGINAGDVEGPPRKRRKSDDTPRKTLHKGGDVEEAQPVEPYFNVPMDVDIGIGTQDPTSFTVAHLRSSEEPGQGRRISRPPSAFGDVSFDVGTQNPTTGSQKSSLFPWDNAGGGSSGGAFAMPGSQVPSVDVVDVRLRGSSCDRRDSSVAPSQLDSLVGVGGPGFSPAPVIRDSSAIGEDYRFEVNAREQSLNHESQQSDMNIISLERNSYDFLEYVKIQSRSLRSATTDLTFDTVVPQATSTRHVAASAFYHCLVLATKDLLRLKQSNAYGSLIISTV